MIVTDYWQHLTTRELWTLARRLHRMGERERAASDDGRNVYRNEIRAMRETCLYRQMPDVYMAAPDSDISEDAHGTRDDDGS